MGGRVAVVPTELVGLLLAKATGTAVDDIPHALRLAAVSYMGAAAGSIPGFSLNERHCRRRYGIKRAVFQKGLRLLRESGAIIARSRLGPRRLAVDTYRAFGPNYVPVAEALVSEPPRVLALYVLTRMRKSACPRDRVCREFGVTSPNTQKKLVERLSALGLLRSSGCGKEALLTCRADVDLELAAIRMRAVKKQAVTKQPVYDVKKQPVHNPSHGFQISSSLLHLQDPVRSGQDQVEEPPSEGDAEGDKLSSDVDDRSLHGGWSQTMYERLRALGDRLLKTPRRRHIIRSEECLLSYEGLEQLGALVSTQEGRRALQDRAERALKSSSIGKWSHFMLLDETDLLPAFSKAEREPASSLPLHYLDTANMSNRLPKNMRHDPVGLMHFLNAHGRVGWGACDLFGEPTFQEALEAMANELRSSTRRPRRWAWFVPCLERLRAQGGQGPLANEYSLWRAEAEREEALRSQIGPSNMRPPRACARESYTG